MALPSPAARACARGGVPLLPMPPKPPQYPHHRHQQQRPPRWELHAATARAEQLKAALEHPHGGRLLPRTRTWHHHGQTPQGESTWNPESRRSPPPRAELRCMPLGARRVAHRGSGRGGAYAAAPPSGGRRGQAAVDAASPRKRFLRPTRSNRRRAEGCDRQATLLSLSLRLPTRTSRLCCEIQA